MNILIGVLMLGIVISLGQALFAMSSGPENSERVIKALTMRVILSVALFVVLMVGWYFHLLEPMQLHR